ncbi:MAG TPA: sulfatase [Thermoanaerobaculia bacterium]
MGRESFFTVWRLAAALALLATGLGCQGDTPPEPEPTRWNVVVLLVDTLRADRLSFYGYERPTAPRLGNLARSGVVFRNTRSQAGCTYPSVNSILTSRWPQHFVNRQQLYGMAIPKDTPSLAGILAGQGYATAAVSASVVVRAVPSRVNRQGGFGQGFQSFDESCLKRSARCVNSRAYKLLDRLPEPFFLYLHYLEPHTPYRPPDDHPRRFALGSPDKEWVRRGEPRNLTKRLYNGDTTHSYDDADVRFFSDMYDEEIAFMDESLAMLMQRLRRKRLLERTIVVLLSDHGEEMLDNGHWGHCRDLAYETLLKTPLVLWVPGGPTGERSSLALNVDLVPTLLDLLGLPHDPAAFAGKSLRPVLEEDRPVHDMSFALQGVSRVASDGRYKWWLDLGGGPPRLYDLRIGEMSSATAFERRPVTRLRAELLAWLEREEGGRQGENLRRARENTEQLKALGYL